jgi:hypothetical protein
MNAQHFEAARRRVTESEHLATVSSRMDVIDFECSFVGRNATQLATKSRFAQHLVAGSSRNIA